MLGRRVEVQAARRDGAAFPADVSLVAIYSGGSPGYAAFVRDLTEQKAGEASLLRGIQLEEENRRVQEASRLKSEFLANMSHELRTPLNAIIGFAELLYDGQVTPDMPQFKDFLHDILTSGQHLLQLINDVLDLSKVEAGPSRVPSRRDRPRADRRRVDRSAAHAGGAEADRHRARDRSGGRDRVFVDRARLKQVLYNYLSNAIKFTPERGPHQRARHRRGRPTTSGSKSRDTGIGISADDLPRLFIEFNQLEAGAAKKHQGTGLGLALTKRLVEAQGGQVGVAQHARARAARSSRCCRDAPHAARRSPVRAASLRQQLGAPSVLVIEDSATDQDAIVRALVDAGFNVETATTRAQALVKLDSAQRSTRSRST